MDKRPVQHRQTVEVCQTRAGISVPTDERPRLLRDLYALGGTKILNRILELDNPREMIQGLTCQDFFWLVKKIGENDCLPLLELASVDQWQHLLDLELWKRDRLDVSQTSHWMSVFQQANCRQLVRWLFSEGEYLAYYHFLRTVEVVVVNDKEETYDFPDGFFSLDGVFRIRVTDPEHRESIEKIIRMMADEDFNRYQALLLGLAGVVPAEVEEEMYRLKNVRLAEYGFLPYEEAVAVYSPLEFNVLKTEKKQDLPNIFDDEETRALVPVLPLDQTGTQNAFMDIVGGIKDPLFLDRLRLEFAGLANQIMAADSLTVHEVEVLVEACKKAARIINLAIERACGRDLSLAENLLRHHSLMTLFRVGFGMVLKLKWEAERWLKGSWFYGQGLNTGFWGEYQGGILKGLLAKRPRHYVGAGETKEYTDFEWLSDLSECLKVLRGLMVLDGLLEKLAESYEIKNLIHSPEITYHPLLFNLWARLLLKMKPSFSGISLVQAKKFFSILRVESKNPPFEMRGFKEIFIKDFMAYATSSDPEAATILENTLSEIWKEFREEYEWVSTEDLEGRYSRFLTIETPQ